MAHLVEALPFKSEGREFNYRCCHCNITFNRSSGRTLVLRSTQPKQKTEPGLSPGNEGGRCVGLTTLPPSSDKCLEILGASASWIPQVLSTPVMG
jgi:hypothetical protein